MRLQGWGQGLAGLALIAALAVAEGCRSGNQSPARAETAGAVGPAPEFGQAFWRHWGDGQAELAGYDLVYPRYGEPRRGTAVAIFVTETFSNSLRVKSDPGRHPESDEFPVIKLNLVRDFPTGVYDYNMMTSAFVALEAVNGQPAGTATKVSFSSQEWCGQVYSQLLLGERGARLTSHSYFDGEADRDTTLDLTPGALAEDAILLWARGLATPLLQPGESREVALVGSLERARVTHRDLAAGRATLSRAPQGATVTVPAGAFEVERRTVAIAGGPTWTVDVEAAAPHRIVRWKSSSGERAELVASDRMKYWEMNGPAGEQALGRLGLSPRPPRTP